MPEDEISSKQTTKRYSKNEKGQKYILSHRTKITLFFGVLFGLAGFLLGFIYQTPRKEHKCKAPQPREAEPVFARHPPDTEVPLPSSPSVLHVFQDSAVCSDSSVCSDIGRNIFWQGGNAVDSALATLACNGLATMQSMGIGGGFIMNVFQRRKNSSYTIIAREKAPATVKVEELSNQGQDPNLQGPMSIAIPGEVMGYHVAHKRFGTMTWKEILQPTIEICQKGFQLSKHQWDSLLFNPRVRNDANLRKMFVNENTGDYKRVGSMIHPPPELCETYRTLAMKGPEDFYTGELTKLVVKDLQDIGSTISLEDLANYRAEVIDSLKLNVGSDILHFVPPVGGGAVVALAINILKGYNFSKGISDLTLTHRIVEALKFAFAQRWNLGDPHFHSLTETLDNMTSTEWAEELRHKIGDYLTSNNPLHYEGKAAPVKEHGTGHISVLAPNGDAVSVTSTIHYYFGSAYMGKRTGILFNSAMGDFSIPNVQNYFSLPPSEMNLLQPHKRPMSSMSPTIVTGRKGNVKLIVGGAGGPKIISALANILVQILWLGKDIKQAIDAPRFHHQLIPDALEYEYGMLKSVVDGLEKIGHKTLRYRERGSAFCGIMKNATAIYANVDFRKMGGVSGF